MTKFNITECDGDLPKGLTFEDGLVAVDCEMMGLNFRRDRLCLCQIGDGKGSVWLVKFDGKNWNAPNLKKVLTDTKLTKIFHYGRYDLASLCHHLGVMAAPVFDTKIASKLTRTYTDYHGLKNLCEEFLGIKLEKGPQTSNWGDKILTEEQKNYAAQDVLYLHEIKEGLEKRLQATGREGLCKQCCDFLPTRAALDLEGWEHHDIFAHHNRHEIG